MQRLVSLAKLEKVLLEIGFRFYEETKKSSCYKRGTDRVYLPKRGHAQESFARSVLYQARCTPEEIARFIAQCNA